MAKDRSTSDDWDWSAYTGAALLGFTQFPDELFDVVMPRVSGAEWKVICYIARRTIGFRKEWDRISWAQFQHGVRRANGTQLDEGTGLGRSTIEGALRNLQRYGIIEVRKPHTGGGKCTGAYYRLRIKTDAPETGPSGSSNHAHNIHTQQTEENGNEAEQPGPQTGGRACASASEHELELAIAEATDLLDISREAPGLLTTAKLENWQPLAIKSAALRVAEKARNGEEVRSPGGLPCSTAHGATERHTGCRW